MSCRLYICLQWRHGFCANGCEKQRDLRTALFHAAHGFMRIMLVISSLRRGGAERSVSILANYWASRDHQVCVVTIEGKESDEYSLSPDVTRIGFNLARVARGPVHGAWNNLRRMRSLRRVVRECQPDVVVSFVTHTNLLTLMALWGTRIPVIAAERIDPSQLSVGVLRERMRGLLYPHAAAVVVQTTRAREVMERKLRGGRFVVIPNPVPAGDPDELQEGVSLRDLAGLQADAKTVVAMGRLDPQKGFDLLIDAFREVHQRQSDWHLIILGEGPARIQLEQQAARLQLAGCVHLPGSVRAARKYLSEADLFVLPSRFEGFPNVLLEAMVCGRPVVSFDCPSGPSEIIRDGYDGILVEIGNVPALSAAMGELMHDSIRRNDLGKNALQVLERFSMARTTALWNQLLSRVSGV